MCVVINQVVMTTVSYDGEVDIIYLTTGNQRSKCWKTCVLFA